MKTQTFFVELTDTYGGEANYSWAKRLKVTATSMRGAVQKVSRETGINWRCAGDFGDQKRYDSKSGCTCFFIESFDDDAHGNMSNMKTI